MRKIMTGIEVDASGKVLSRQNESKERKENGEKGEDLARLRSVC